MYTPRYHALIDTARMHDHIARHPLGAWVCKADEQLANHIPFVLDRDHGTHGRLLGHVARANPAWRVLNRGVPAVVMFMGPNAYITPAWYPGKFSHGKVVPTWNYVTVHAHGVARAVDEPGWILDMLHRLTDAQEASRSDRWKVSDAPAGYIEQAPCGGGDRDPDRSSGGPAEAEPDESHEVRLGTVAGLMAVSDAPTQALAVLVREELKLPGE